MVCQSTTVNGRFSCVFLLGGLLSGCGAEIQDVSFLPGTIGTVVTAEWRSDIDGVGVVSFVVDGAQKKAKASQHANPDGSFSYTATLLGLRTDAQYEAVVEVRPDDGDPAELGMAFESGPLSVALPGLTTSGTSSTPEGYFLTSIAMEPTVACIIDADGRYVWAMEDPTDDRVLSALRPDPHSGRLVYAATEAQQDAESIESELVWVSLDGDSIDRVSLPNMHHDFLIHDDGTVAYIAYEPRTVDGERWRGDQIVERYADGSTSVVWSTWDDVPFDHIQWAGPDWTHANALNYDPDEDAYYLSSYTLGALYKIDRASGTLLWTMGGPHSDFAVSAEPPLLNQHQFELLGDDRILVFNNRPRSEQSSLVQEYTLDEDAGTAEAVWSYEPGIFSVALGDVHRLESGNTLGTFSTAGIIDEIGPDGERVWRLEGAFGTVFGYTEHVTDLQVLVP